MCSEYNSLKSINVVDLDTLHIDEFIEELEASIPISNYFPVEIIGMGLPWVFDSPKEIKEFIDRLKGMIDE